MLALSSSLQKSCRSVYGTYTTVQQKYVFVGQKLKAWDFIRKTMDVWFYGTIQFFEEFFHELYASAWGGGLKCVTGFK